MFKSSLIALALTLGASSAFAGMMVGGAEMFPAKNIIENAVNSKDHTTLVAAVKAAAGERGTTVVVVGHQPDCSQIAAALTGGPEPAFPPGAVVAVEV